MAEKVKDGHDGWVEYLNQSSSSFVLKHYWGQGLEVSPLPAWNNLELIKLEPEDPPAVLYQGADAQGACRGPGHKN